jgi:5-methylcytosine-specific restriction endonuclease McrA
MTRRDWTAARRKVDLESVCRVCHGTWALQAAHIIPRSRIKPGLGEDARNIVPLCPDCHKAYDEGGFDLLPYLSHEEQAYAVGLVGLFEAYRRISNERLFAS